MRAPPQTKGTSVAAVIRFVEKEWGTDGLARLAAAVRPVEAAGLVSGQVLAGSWYPFAHFVALLETAETLFGGQGDISRREGMYCADYDLRGVYRVFIKLASPSFLVERAGKVWRQYYDSGELVVTESGPAAITFELREFAAPHRAHCETVLGWSQRAAELTGVGKVTGHHPRCRARGDANCVFRVSWGGTNAPPPLP
jgi:hypothetical protein